MARFNVGDRVRITESAFRQLHRLETTVVEVLDEGHLGFHEQHYVLDRGEAWSCNFKWPESKLEPVDSEFQSRLKQALGL